MLTDFSVDADKDERKSLNVCSEENLKRFKLTTMVI